MSWIPLTIGLTVVWMAPLAQGDEAGSLADLSRLVAADGPEYGNLRSEVLKTTTGPWDVTVAAKQSWEAGLAAFILNQHLAQPMTFARLDEKQPRASRSICGQYRFDASTSRDAKLAFLLERTWKDESVEVREAQAAYEVLRGCMQPDVSNVALWRALWQQGDDERFRYVAVFHLCADPDALDIIGSVLRDTSENAKRFKSRCLSGIAYSNSQEAMDLVLDLWDDLRAQLFTPNGILAKSANPRAREMMYTVALNPAESSGTRVSTVGLISKYPQPGDRAFLQQFFAKVKSGQLKEEVLRNIADWFPFEWYREPVREILKTLSDRELKTSTWVGSKTWTEREIVRMAALALMRGHGAQTPRIDRQRQRKEWTYDAAYRRPDAKESARRLDVDAWEEDMALLKEVVQRDNLPQDLRDSIARRLEDMYELRRRSEKQRQGD